MPRSLRSSFFFFNDTATTEIYTLSLHDALPLIPLWRDLASAYEARHRGESPKWTPLQVQYADYALWQRNTLGDESNPNSAMSRQLAYWRHRLAGLPEELELPTDRLRPVVGTYRGERICFRIQPELHGRLLSLAIKAQASLYMVLQTGVAALLCRLGAGTDISLGSPVAGRTDDALSELIGFFVNVLVLRTDTSRNPSLRELLARVRTHDLAAYAHQDLSFEHLVEVLNRPRSRNRHPLFQVLLTLQNNEEACFRLAGLKAAPETVD